jgi:hypothetical protein
MIASALHISAPRLRIANLHDENKAEKRNVERNPAASVHVTLGITGGRTKREPLVGSGNVCKGAIKRIEAVEASDGTPSIHRAKYPHRT